MRRFLFVGFFLFTPMAAHAGTPELLSRWVEMVPGGAEARAVVTGNTCPDIAIDGKASPMVVRAQAEADFPLLCSASIPAGAKAATVMGAALPLPVKSPRRILVFGDTGCRIEGATVQACNDPARWPFPEIAAAGAKAHPDLVIHVGDYLYRESACPAGNAACAGTPHGDNWASWAADFFYPASPLLDIAPWVTVRGNHEDCNHAGPGWLRLLGPWAFDPQVSCVPHLAPYTVPAGAMNLVVMDDADAPDIPAAHDLVPVYRNEIEGLAKVPAPVWLLMHRPVWAAISGPLGIPIGGNATLIDAIDGRGMPPTVALMLAGHIHTFEALNYYGEIPPQIVAGFGGDNLNITPHILKGTIFQGNSGVAVKDGLSVGGFGFLLMTKEDKGWRVGLYRADGTEDRVCHFAAGRVDCP